MDSFFWFLPFFPQCLKSKFEITHSPRVCLGKNMAELEGVFVMVCLLRRFEVDVLDHEKVTYGNSLTLPMKDGMKVRIVKREE